MSAGDHHQGTNAALSSATVDRILKNPEFQRHLHKHNDLNRDYDLPYLGGYSKDGSTTYLDRHLPETIPYSHQGTKREFDPGQFVRLHEEFEKACIDCLGWGYYHAHHGANGYEKRAVMRAGMLWTPYSKALEPFIKADEHEKLTKIPSNLDMTPYYAPPVDRKLILHMEKAMGKEQTATYTKDEVEYSSKGHAGSHCGPVSKWPKGECEYFKPPHSCELVKGYIEPAGWCKKWHGDQ